MLSLYYERERKDEGLGYTPKYKGVAISASNPIPFTIKYHERWNAYGFVCPHVRKPGTTITGKLGEYQMQSTDFVDTAPTGNQCRIHESAGYKMSFFEFNGSQDGATFYLEDMTAYMSLVDIDELNTAFRWLNILIEDRFVADYNTLINLPASKIINHLLYKTIDTGKLYYTEDAGMSWIELTTSGSGTALSWTHTPAHGSSGNPVSINLDTAFNKQFLKLSASGTEAKLYPTETDRENDTNAISATVSFVDGYILRIDPLADLTNNEDYYVRIFSGLQFADGGVLESDIDYSVTVGVFDLYETFTEPDDSTDWQNRWISFVSVQTSGGVIGESEARISGNKLSLMARPTEALKYILHDVIYKTPYNMPTNIGDKKYIQAEIIYCPTLKETQFGIGITNDIIDKTWGTGTDNSIRLHHSITERALGENNGQVRFEATGFGILGSAKTGWTIGLNEVITIKMEIEKLSSTTYKLVGYHNDVKIVEYLDGVEYLSSTFYPYFYVQAGQTDSEPVKFDNIKVW